MKVYTKGNNSRSRLVHLSKEIFNEHGFGVTLANLAKSLKITLGMLTYHFATKDHLFIAIAEEYQQRFQEIRTSEITGPLNLKSLYALIEKIMDLQFEYRCAIRYVATSSKKQMELADHITKSYRNSKIEIKQMLQALILSGEISESILSESNFNVFLFGFTCMLTSWPFNLEVYDTTENYENQKPVYLKGIFSTFLQHITPDGKKSLKQLGIVE